MRRLGLAVLVLCAAPAAAAPPLPAEMAPGESVRVAEIVDGDTLRLADGRTVRLAAVATARPLLPRLGATAAARDSRLAALAAAAHRHLRDWTRGEVSLHPATPAADRHGRVVGHIVSPSHGWLQAALLEEGLARVQTTEATSAGAVALLAVEAAARAARRGLWSHPLFQVRSAAESGRWLDSFQLVEGPVAAVHDGRRTTRVEIGEGERRLLLLVPSKVRAELRRAGIDLAALTGRAVRVRGWIEWQDGPRIDLSHAAALELLAR